MRLLFESANTEELEQKRALLENKGIPVFISGEESYRVRPLLVAYEKGFWVCIDAQYHDAQALLVNKDHHVVAQVDVELFHRDLLKLQKDPMHKIFGNGKAFLNYLAIASLLFFGVWIGWVVISQVA